MTADADTDAETITLSAAVLLLLQEVRSPYVLAHRGAELISVLNELADSAGVRATGPHWWSAFDEYARHVDRSGLDATVPASAAPERQKLVPVWDWALAVCAADGRTRQRALALESLPLGAHALIPLLVVRCSDWAAPVRAAARTALTDVLTRSGPAELARAAVMAWSCEERGRGGDAVRIVAACLAGAAPEVWRGLLADPDHRVRRRALSAAVDLDRCETTQLLSLAGSDPDVVVARCAAEHLLRSLVPPGNETPASSQAETVLRRLLDSRVSAVRAVTVTVLRRAQRPDLAEPFTADRSEQVREIARWVLRSHRQDPAPVCRARLARPAREITPGAIAGLAECGDVTGGMAADLLRPHLTHQRPGVRAAVLRALGTMRPPAVSAAELLAVMDHDPSPRVQRAAATLLEAASGTIPRQRLNDLLAPGRPAPLRS
ncbi:HEAT repeat domain-containing protein [Streptomyces fildesensis]|uniref:HEAT repeat domain-containing protein n=1 Tax=Streptomyces fildesensis TaxID=375757 RepID=A0ABW8CHY8_9ACTN